MTRVDTKPRKEFKRSEEKYTLLTFPCVGQNRLLGSLFQLEANHSLGKLKIIKIFKDILIKYYTDF